MIISVQLNNRYGYYPLGVDNRFIIRADLDKTVVSDIVGSLEKTRCYTSKGILIDTSSLQIASEASVFWRAKTIDSDVTQQFCQIAIDGTDDTVKKEIFTGNTKQGFSPIRSKWNPRCLLVNNAENFIPKTSPFEAVSINYDRAAYPFFVWNIDPIVLYFILTLIFGFLFKPIIKVNI